MLKAVFAPDHFVHDTDVALDDADYFCRDILIHVIGNWNTWAVVLYQLYCDVHALQQAFSVDATQDEAAFVEGFGALCAGTDADCWEGMADAGEETAFLWKGAAIADYSKGIHLKAVVVVETKWLVLNDTLIQLEA